jgi:protein-S-isoprenylcysteine O-methyltransferase Ste14
VLYLLRHLASVLLLPTTVVVLVPIWIGRRVALDVDWPASAAGVLAAMAGVVAFLAGLILFASSLRRFAGEGRGTLAPWDPPRRLVVRGPYRYVRNPMISGVIVMLIGEALLFRSWPLGAWASTFFAINALYIPLFEEPQLERRFGDEYRRYRRHVPGLLPRLRPWDP